MDIERGEQTFGSKLKNSKTLLLFIVGAVILLLICVGGFFLHSRSPIIISNGIEVKVENPNFFSITINNVSWDRIIGKKSQIRYQLAKIDNAFVIGARGSVSKTLETVSVGGDGQNVKPDSWNAILKECKPQEHATKKSFTFAGGEYVIQSKFLFYGDSISRQKDAVEKIKCPSDGKIELKDIKEYHVLTETKKTN